MLAPGKNQACRKAIPLPKSANIPSLVTNRLRNNSIDVGFRINTPATLI